MQWSLFAFYILTKPSLRAGSHTLRHEQRRSRERRVGDTSLFVPQRMTACSQATRNLSFSPRNISVSIFNIFDANPIQVKSLRLSLQDTQLFFKNERVQNTSNSWSKNSPILLPEAAILWFGHRCRRRAGFREEIENSPKNNLK